jgi:hypothetical protein
VTRTVASPYPYPFGKQMGRRVRPARQLSPLLRSRLSYPYPYTLQQGSATLSMAYAAALFADSCLRGLNGTPTVECTYVESTITDAPYFASKVKLSTEGQ